MRSRPRRAGAAGAGSRPAQARSPRSPPASAWRIAAGLCGLGQARAIAAALEGMARQPGAAARIRTAMIIGLALIESLAIYMLVIAFILLFVKTGVYATGGRARAVARPRRAGAQHAAAPVPHRARSPR